MDANNVQCDLIRVANDVKPAVRFLMKAAICAKTGGIGLAMLAPIAVAAKWVGEHLKDSLPVTAAGAEVVSHILAELSGKKLESFVDAFSAESNQDLERAMAKAIRLALEEASKAPGNQEFRDWFSLWDKALD